MNRLRRGTKISEWGRNSTSKFKKSTKDDAQTYLLHVGDELDLMSQILVCLIAT